jgi:hypothetical protein
MKKYFVSVIAQTKPMGCWAASIAMILSWKEKKSYYTPDLIAKECGYTQNREAGLAPNDTGPLTYWGFKWLAPQSLTIDGLYRLLMVKGPLWVATKSPFPPPNGPLVPHIRVVTGMKPHADAHRTIIYINDPAPIRRGSSYEESYL